MDLSSLEATFEANKTPILAAAGAGVVGLGLYAKKKKAAAGSAGAATVGGASSGGQTAGMTGGAAYDSSASDLYGAIQPQLESLGGQLTDLRNLYGSSASSGSSAPAPTPVPAPTPAPTSTTTGTSAPSVTPIPTPVYDSSTAHILSGNAAAGGTATWSPATAALASNGYGAGRIDSATSPVSAQTYVPYATSPTSVGLLSQQSLPQTGSAGPVGTVTPDGYKVTGYSFNGAPRLSAVNAAGQVLGFDGKPV